MSCSVLVTGWADGLGLAAARELVADGYALIGHAGTPRAPRAKLPVSGRCAVARGNRLLGWG